MVEPLHGAIIRAMDEIARRDPIEALPRAKRISDGLAVSLGFSRAGWRRRPGNGHRCCDQRQNRKAVQGRMPRLNHIVAYPSASPTLPGWQLSSR